MKPVTNIKNYWLEMSIKGVSSLWIVLSNGWRLIMENGLNEYLEVEKALLDIPKFTQKTELTNTEKVLNRLGILKYYKGEFCASERAGGNITSKSEGPKIIHIAGTNGKGSVAKFTSLMLQSSGYKTGLFTSPHLIRINERISIDGNEISDDALVDIYARVKSVVTEMVEEDLIQHPAFFEYLFIMAALYFQEQKCDYIVLETGLGGRLDATNIVTPEVSVITSIGLDHMQYLGDTIPKIAGEKAGIIKKGIPVVYNTGEIEADVVIEKKAEEQCSPRYKVSDYSDLLEEQVGADIFGLIDSFTAKYQRDNFLTAALTFAVLEDKIKRSSKNSPKSSPKSSISFDENDIKVLKNAVKSFSWPGRMEFMDEDRRFLVDGAHNEDAIIRFVESLEELCEQRYEEMDSHIHRVPLSLLFAVSNDKDYDNIVKVLTDKLNSLQEKVSASIFIGELSNDRRTKCAELVSIFKKYMGQEALVYGYDSVADAWDEMLKYWKKENETQKYTDHGDPSLFVAVGSLYLVGDIKKLYEEYLQKEK